VKLIPAAAGLPVLLFTLVMVLSSAITRADASGLTVYRSGDRNLNIGGLIQLQYHYRNPDNGPATDELFFRRLRLYIEAGILKDWSVKIQPDFGDANDDNEVKVEDAFILYRGFKGIEVSLGNMHFAFSRELLTSSKKYQFVEKTFTGDHNYGTPDRQLGIHVRGSAMDKKVAYGIGLVAADIDPDAARLHFVSPVNRDSDSNEGWMIGARVGYHPFGPLKFEHGDFKRDGLKATAALGAFIWQNDNDNNTRTSAGADTSGGVKPDVDSVAGLEISGALRYIGISVDSEYNFFHAETSDPTVTGGIFRDGSTNLDNFSIHGGYMAVPGTIELAAGFEVQDADNYSALWTRTALGVNYFYKRHKIKAQVTYRIGKNVDGMEGNDEDELFVQAQYFF